MRVYQYSCEEYEEGIDITVDSEVLMYLIIVFKEHIKEVVGNDDFESVRMYVKDLDTLERKLNELLKREGKEDADSKTE